MEHDFVIGVNGSPVRAAQSVNNQEDDPEDEGAYVNVDSPDTPLLVTIPENIRKASI